MKTGILTFHSAFNFGASLQTWALQETLKKLGAEPFVINYRPGIIDHIYNPFANKKGLKKSAFLRKIKNPDQMLRFEKYERFIKENYNLLGEAHTYQELQNEKYDLDACIVGSDQVWNIQHTGGDLAYFLGFLDENIKKISYAASIGTEYILPTQYKKFCEGMKRFSYISVREESAKKALESLTDKDINVVLDPTLLLDVEEYDKLKIPVSYSEKYILVYMMEDNPQLIEMTNFISKLLGLPVVQRRQKRYFENEIKSCYTYVPGEFLSCMENAEMVITNSFHGTVFSILYGKPFVSMLHSDTGSRTVDLLKKLHLESHLIYEFQREECLKKFSFNNYHEVKQILVREREKSLDFLKRALEIEK